MAGFVVNTVRSGSNAGDKLNELYQFTSPRSSSQIFIANLNIMSAGVNLHAQCYKGILINFTYNAKTILQILHRLLRIGQEKAVEWHILKTSHSFHDYQERSCLTKWANQISAEAGLPD